VSKFTVACLLAVTAAVFITACAKEQPDVVVAAPAPENTAAAPESTASTMPAMPESHPAPSAPDENVDLSGIERAEGGKTIAEIYAEKDQLAGEEIVLRGKVVKANAGIMGTNWLHVRDGSGTEGANSLTVTTPFVLPNVGDTVVVQGTLQLNKDFGMGYQYDLIIEEANVAVEDAAPM